MSNSPLESSSTADSNAAPQTRNLEGAMWMIASGVVFTMFLTLSKVQSADFDPGFLSFWRAFIALLATLPIILLQGRKVLILQRPGLILLRSLFGTLGFIFGFYAVSDQFGLPLAEFNAISFSRALFITLLAAVLLKEKVGAHRWGATLVGFVGVVIITQPQAGMSIGMGLALLAAASLAGAITLVKTLSRDHRPVTLLIWANLLSSVLLLPVAIWKWPEISPSLQQWGAISLMGFSGLFGQYFYIRAMSMGDASFLSPFDYFRLPMAGAVDWLLWQVLPGPWVWVGTAIIISATLYITLRERRLKLAQVPVEDSL